MNKSDSPVLLCQGLAKSYDEGSEKKLEILTDVNLAVFAAERLAIVGASGSGKSTLLQLLAGLDQPTSGRVSICGRDVAGLSDHEKGVMRNQHLGFVYQFHHLLPEFSARENVAMPLLLRKGMKVQQAGKLADDMLHAVGLAERRQHKPAELSGGRAAACSDCQGTGYAP